MMAVVQYLGKYLRKYVFPNRLVHTLNWELVYVAS